MRTITFDVNQQRIKNTNSISHIYKGTDNYLQLKFNFSEDWDGCKKAISFGSKDFAMLLDNDDSCMVPKEAFDEKKLSFYIIGGKNNYRIQTQVFNIRIGG